MVVVSDPSETLAISLQVVAISGPPFAIHGLVTSRRLDSEEAKLAVSLERRRSRWIQLDRCNCAGRAPQSHGPVDRA